jgi:hypothetical protein
MSLGYAGAFLSLPAIFDRLVAAGRTPDAAVREMISAIQEGGLELFDRGNAAYKESLPEIACRGLDEYLARLAGERMAGNPYLAVAAKNIAALSLRVEKVFCLGGSEARKPAGLRSGAPGRPSSMDIVRNEHKSRCECGAASRSVTEESKFLAQWLKTSHPDTPQPTAKTIKNKISADHRQYVARN